MKPRVAHTSHNHDHRIDQALRRIGSATPPEGMEDRITARLARERSRTHAARSGRLLFLGIPRMALGAAAGAVACVGIVVGSVSHSHRIQPVLPGIGTHSSSAGMGSANAARPADRPVSPSPTERPRSVRRLQGGRAVISPQSQKPAGVAVPKTPSPAQ
ncbi:MAG TPA: hypothetical protein VE178_09670 [Silvibacterium sp.]|jgi:hypothetical protein|nr:hypothetical protein [Silvibacterium sp.]